MKKISIGLFFVLIMAIAGTANAVKADIGASGAVLMDLNTNRILASKNAHQRLPMASTTKIMTALLVVENCSINDIITVPSMAVGIEGSSMYLKEGEKISVEDLLYGLMLTSGNDAAMAFALHLGKTKDGFAKMMNNRALQLGCNNTNFTNPNGLPDNNHYTTAYDLAIISCAAMKNDIIKGIVNTQYHETSTGEIKRTIKNKNRILWEYDGGTGIKTGYTKAAGRCLAFSAQRDNNTLIGIVLNAPDMWNEAKAMLNYGFDEHVWEQYAKAGEVIATIDVKGGMKNNLEIIIKEDILFPLRKDEQKSDITLKKVMPDVIIAPVYSGQDVGTLEIWHEGKMQHSVKLVASESIMKKEYPFYLQRVIQEFLA